MVGRLKGLLDEIAACARAGARAGAMRRLAQFTLLLEEFLRQNARYIFSSEVASLNRCLAWMENCLEADDLEGLAGGMEAGLRGFLDDWDFRNKQIN